MNKTSSTTSNARFLIFKLQDALFALDLAQTAEVSDLMPLWPVPLAPPYYSGAINFHGNIIAVMDLVLFLGLPGHSKPEKTIILHQSIASLAFLVDSVVRIVSAEETRLSAITDAKFSTTTLSLPEGKALLLDLEVVVREAELDLKKILLK
ncbi:MAG: chemotaxis protein CheW [Desulfuromonadaceae bacterium]|nr:chemotaxis protein CheW [Desulfuromonadaceae bacterium]MDD2848110.1 chemotaxis protein CheW [Desulfuromonadaceae bacterium]MDD4132049.1 chemotaxis protein CheW [Desulfuromonadaceae bacterium]